jgi:hypothetical protein
MRRETEEGRRRRETEEGGRRKGEMEVESAR